MRDKRAIIIKNPRLQKIRNNLRRLLLAVVSVKWNKLFDEMDRLRYTPGGTRRTVDDFTSDELREYRAYQAQQNDLRKLSDKSICKCVMCGKADRDMVYNKAYDAWYCTFCYGLELASARQRLDIKPYLQLPEDHPFFTGKDLEIYNTLMTEIDLFIDYFILENLMMYHRNIDENDIRNEFKKLPSKLQKLWILEAWLFNTNFSENLRKFNEKRKEVKKKPSNYKFNTYIFQVQSLPEDISSKRRSSRKFRSHEDEAVESHSKTFL